MKRLRFLCLPVLLLVIGNPARAQETCAIANSDFKRVVLVDQPDEAMKLTVLPDGRVLWSERKGTVMIYNPDTQLATQAGKVDAYTTEDNGLQGIARDPGFAVNHWIYLDYDLKSDANPAGPGRWLSRFTMVGDTLDMASEKRILHVEIDRTHEGGCCHQAGALAFDPKGNIYWGIGEDGDYSLLYANTSEANPFQSSFRSSANSNDLRGKVVRIHPEPDGSYTIPDGNLFPKGLAKTRPEIFAMGTRNAFTVKVDGRTGNVWIADVGIDATAPSPDKGAEGYEEINLLTKAAHLGHPFVNGPNDPLRNYDYVNDKPLEWFDPNHMVNNSVFNTGLVDLAPAGKPLSPLIYWTHSKKSSTAFPDFGEGRMAGMVGPAYRYDAALVSARKLPAFFDGKVFFWDYEREWVRVLTLAAGNTIGKIEQVMTDIPWSGIVDMELGPDGALYVVEYGHGFYTANPSAKISRIDYVGKPCGSTAVTSPVPGPASAPPIHSELKFADPASGLDLDLPPAASRAEAYGLRGERLWGSVPPAASGSVRPDPSARPVRLKVPGSVFPGKGLVLIRYR